MKQCPIAAQIAGSIRILPCCVLNEFAHIGVWAFDQYVRPFLATILCVWEIWSGSNNCIYVSRISLRGKKKDYQTKKGGGGGCITAPILKPTYVQKLFWPKSVFPDFDKDHPSPVPAPAPWIVSVW